MCGIILKVFSSNLDLTLSSKFFNENKLFSRYYDLSSVFLCLFMSTIFASDKQKNLSTASVIKKVVR